jgi:hypothetical protein
MPLRPFEIKPGIVKDITAYAAGKNGPFWTDGDKVRFSQWLRDQNRWLAKASHLCVGFI